MIDEAVRRVLASPHIEIARYGGEDSTGEIGFVYVRKGPIADIRAEFRRVEAECENPRAPLRNP